MGQNVYDIEYHILSNQSSLYMSSCFALSPVEGLMWCGVM